MLDANSREGIRLSDEWIDAGVSQKYRDQPLAQDWARITKVAEEVGEAITQLILWTGQNPRKGTQGLAEGKMLMELADVACTGILAIQHFTKDIEQTDVILSSGLTKIVSRAWDAGYR